MLAAAFVIAYAVRWVPDVATVLMLAGTLALALRLLGESGGLALWAAWGAGIGMVGAVFAEPLTAARSYGALALAMTTFALILAMLHAAASLAARRTPIGPLQRVPVVALLAGWIAVAWVTAPAELHQARTVKTSGAPTTFKQAVHAWLDAQPKRKGPLPMLIVGASGGGSKAAYWTDLVIDCALWFRHTGRRRMQRQRHRRSQAARGALPNEQRKWRLSRCEQLAQAHGQGGWERPVAPRRDRQ